MKLALTEIKIIKNEFSFQLTDELVKLAERIANPQDLEDGLLAVEQDKLIAEVQNRVMKSIAEDILNCLLPQIHPWEK